MSSGRPRGSALDSGREHDSVPVADRHAVLLHQPPRDEAGEDGLQAVDADDRSRHLAVPVEGYEYLELVVAPRDMRGRVDRPPRAVGQAICSVARRGYPGAARCRRGGGVTDPHLTVRPEKHHLHQSRAIREERLHPEIDLPLVCIVSHEILADLAERLDVVPQAEVNALLDPEHVSDESGAGFVQLVQVQEPEQAQQGEDEEAHARSQRVPVPGVGNCDAVAGRAGRQGAHSSGPDHAAVAARHGRRRFCQRTGPLGSAARRRGHGPPWALPAARSDFLTLPPGPPHRCRPPCTRLGGVCTSSRHEAGERPESRGARGTCPEAPDG